MSYNGSGTFVINSAGQPVVTGTVITTTAFNALTADLGTGLSTAITKDGQTTPTADIPMGAFKITGLGAGTAATDAVRLSQLQAGGTTFLSAAGTDTITATASPSLTAYATGNLFTFVVANTNTGAVTLNVDGLGAKAITRDGTTALAAADLVATEVVVVVYDGTRFQVVNPNAATNFRVTGTLGVTGATTLSSTLGVTGVASFADGAVGTPGVTFTSDPDSGIYRIGANNLGVAVNGAKVLDIATTGLGVTGNVTATNLVALGAANLKLFVNAGATAPEYAKGIKVGSFTYNTATASGNLSTTGVGFKPSAIVFFNPGNGGTDGSWGFAEGTANYSTFQVAGAGMSNSVVECVYFYQAAGTRNYAGLFSFDADGFTLVWTKIGAMTGTVTIGYLALR